jgi:hypothetical protein
MSERQRRRWDCMVTKVCCWMESNDNRLPEAYRVPASAAETCEKAIARTLEILRGVQTKLREGAPHLYSLLEAVSYSPNGISS